MWNMKELRGLFARVLSNQQRQEKMLMALTDKLNQAALKLDALAQTFGDGFTQLKADIQQAFDDWKAQNGGENNPALNALADSVNAKIDGFASSVTAAIADEDTTVKAEDPGPPAAAPAG